MGRAFEKVSRQGRKAEPERGGGWACSRARSNAVTSVYSSSHTRVVAGAQRVQWK